MNFIFENDTFEYNLESEDGVIAVRPSFKPPRKIKEFIDVINKNNILSKDLEIYEPREISVPLTYIKYNIDNFRLFELEGLRGKLFFPNYFKGTYFEVENVEVGEVDDNYGVGEVEVTFLCNPFRRSDYNNIPLEKNNVIFNPGTIESIPIFYITGNGNFKFKINDIEVSIENIENSIILDIERMEIYKLVDGIPVEQGNKVYEVNLKKIFLKHGENTIDIISGNYTEFNLKFKENYL